VRRLNPVVRITNHHTIYDGPLGALRRHCHAVIALLFGLDGPFRLTSAELSVDAVFALVPAGVMHTLDFRGRRTLVLYVEPHDPIYPGLHLFAQGKCHTHVEFSETLRAGIADWDRTHSEKTLLHAILSNHSAPAAMLDDRLRSTCEHFNRGALLDQDTDGLAGRVDLSPSRFLHLLKAELGVGTRRLKQHYRFKILVREVARGATLTQAAHSAGFADSAHLSRAFVETFGLPPTHALSAGVQLEIVD